MQRYFHDTSYNGWPLVWWHPEQICLSSRRAFASPQRVHILVCMFLIIGLLLFFYISATMTILVNKGLHKATQNTIWHAWGGDAWVFAVDRLELLSWLVNAAVTSDVSAVMFWLAVSEDGLAASKPPSQVVMETCGSGISCSGRVSVSGSRCVSGTTLIPRPSRARDLVTMAQVGSARLHSFERVITGAASVARGARAKPDSER